jgi:Flp pilus assembly protein TadD
VGTARHDGDLAERARAAAAAGRIEEAERLLRILLAERPADLDALRSLAHLQRRRGADGEAEVSLRQIAYLAPGDEAALLELADLADRDGRHGLARRYRQRALDAHLAGEQATGEGG